MPGIDAIHSGCIIISNMKGMDIGCQMTSTSGSFRTDLKKEWHTCAIASGAVGPLPQCAHWWVLSCYADRHGFTPIKILTTILVNDT